VLSEESKQVLLENYEGAPLPSLQFGVCSKSVASSVTVATAVKAAPPRVKRVVKAVEMGARKRCTDRGNAYANLWRQIVQEGWALREPRDEHRSGVWIALVFM